MEDCLTPNEEMALRDFLTKRNKRTDRQREYHKYIVSDDWKRRSAVFRESFGHKCAFCDSKSNLHLHHLTYERIGREVAGDVVLLCKGCHLKAHRGYLIIYAFSPEEREAFEKIKHIIVDPKKDYLLLKE